MSRPRISVIMGAYNTERYIAEAIESILKQTYRDFEFIIIDDASTDGTPAVINRYAKHDRRIRTVSNRENLGLTKSLNKGMRLARGELIARMDADDVAMPQRFAEQARFLERHPDIAIVGTWADIIDGKGKRIGEIKYATDDAAIRGRLVGRSQFIHPSVMFRRSALRSTGYYDETFRSAQDYEYFPRMLTMHKGANIPRKLMKYRWDFSQNEGFTTGKRQERNAMRARWRMLTRYGWPWWQAVYLVKPAISYLVPMGVKRMILKTLKRGGK